MVEHNLNHPYKEAPRMWAPRMWAPHQRAPRQALRCGRPVDICAGYTLIELLVVVVLLGIIARIGLPIYIGYVDTTKTNVVKNNLRAIALQQQEYLNDNNVYYTTGTTCTDAYTQLNTTLFNGKQVLSSDGWRYCVLQSTATDFTARAEEKTGKLRTYTLDYNNTANF